MFSLPLKEHSKTGNPLSLLSARIKENYKNPVVGVIFFFLNYCSDSTFRLKMFSGAFFVHLPAFYRSSVLWTHWLLVSLSLSLNVECVRTTQHSALSHTWLTAISMSVMHIQPLEEHLGSILSLVLLSAEGLRKGRSGGGTIIQPCKRKDGHF